MFDKRLDGELRLQQLLGKENPVIVECGANNGSTTKQFFERFPQARIFCFEPDPRNIAKHRALITEKKCTLVETAISNRDGTIELHQSVGRPKSKEISFVHTGASTIKGWKQQMHNTPWVKYLPPIKVKCTRLDTWLKEVKIDIIDFMWVDVEGATKELIGGGLKTLTQTRNFYTECWFEAGKKGQSRRPHYGGEPSLHQIAEILGSDFELVNTWACDALFRNRRLT